MKLYRVGLAAAGLLIFSTIAFAAGLFPDFPVVGGATYCAGSSQSAVGSIIGTITGCPNQVPAGPTIVTGNEQIPADTRLTSGANPQTVLLGMASLNANPIVVQIAVLSSANNLSATNTMGGVIFTAPTTISNANVSLPPTPIDGQQFAITASRTVTTLLVSATTPATQSVTNTPTVITASATAPFGYRFVWNALSNTWNRLQ